MGKYFPQQGDLNKMRKEPHPIWRGIGCFLILIVPVISYALSFLVINMLETAGYPMPLGLGGYPAMPDLLFRVPGLVGILSWIEGRYNLYAYLALTLAMILVVAGVFSFFYALMYRMVGPPRYTRLDAPPTNVKVRKYRR